MPSVTVTRHWPRVIAAGLVVVAGLAAGRWAVLGGRHRALGGAYTTYTTTNGQVARLTLSDGSQVVLAPNSRIEVSRDFRTSRDVMLHGEAYFHVAATQAAPFLVQTGAVTTRVLGTEFDVRRYSADSTTRVVVVSGKVAAGSASHAPSTLVAGTVGHFTDSTGTVTVSNDVGNLTGWTAGRLRFREVPVADVLAQLSRWYDIDFRLADSALAGERVTAALDYTETTDVVRTLEYLLNVTATNEGTRGGRTVVLLRPRHATSRTAPVRTRWENNELTQTEVGR